MDNAPWFRRRRIPKRTSPRQDRVHALCARQSDGHILLNPTSFAYETILLFTTDTYNDARVTRERSSMGLRRIDGQSRGREAFNKEKYKQTKVV